MTKLKLNFIFVILILVLISMAIYCGIEIQKTTTATMEWQSISFRITNKTKVFVVGAMFSIIGYIFLRKQISKTS